MRVFGLPMQFVIVVLVSVALTVYLMAWAASARVEARSQQGIAASPDTVGMTGGVSYGKAATRHTETQAWESAVLAVCPLH